MKFLPSVEAAAQRRDIFNDIELSRGSRHIPDSLGVGTTTQPEVLFLES